MKQTLASFIITPSTGSGEATTARLAADVQFQATTGEVHPPGSDRENYTEYTLTDSGDGKVFPQSVIDSTDDSDDPNATYTMFLMNGNKQVGVLFERWRFPSGLGSFITYSDLTGYNTNKVPLRDDQVYTKNQVDNLLAGRTFATPATEDLLGVVTLDDDSGGSEAVGVNSPRIPQYVGVDTLVDGVVTVLNASVTADSKFQMTGQAGVSGIPHPENIIAGESFDIVSSNGLDNGEVLWSMYNNL
jgi:hypothetical protein